ncbi:MAG: YfhO family protein, partial [Anaerolineae bacterium]
AVTAPDDEAALALLSDPAFDPARQVILAGAPAPAAPPALPDAPPAVRILSYQAEEVHLEADLEAPGYVVLTDAYYPGWEAEVDGQPAPIQRADVYFRAVALEAGRHEVVFRYRPASLRLGLAISGGAGLGLLLAGLALLLVPRRRA